MLSEQPNKPLTQSEYNLSLRIIMILVAIEVIILVSISFVKIYVDKKQSIVRRIEAETKTLEKSFVRDIELSISTFNYVYEIIKDNYDDIENISITFSNYSSCGAHTRLYSSFGYYWIGKDGKVKVSNRAGTFSVGVDATFLTHVRLSTLDPGKIFYGINPNSSHKITKTLGIASGIYNSEGEYVGSLLLEMDTSMILQNLESFRHDNTNFAIIDQRLNVLTSYPIKSNKLGVNVDSIDNHDLLNTIKHLRFKYDSVKTDKYLLDNFSDTSSSYLNMWTGENYYIQHLGKYPFILVTSIDPEIVHEIITQKLFVKFLEVTILASFFFIIVIVVYKRQTWLRAKAEKASRLAIKAMNAKSDFLSYAAHEIRSPLGFILTGSEIMDKKLFGDVPTQYQEYVTGIYHNAKLILDFINDILDERHIVSGNFKVIENICNIDDIISKSILTNRTRFHNRKIEIKKEIEENLPSLKADDRRILQALNNLISNSFKYSLDNTKIRVIAKLSKGYLCVIVKDEGIGMSEEDIEIALTKYGMVHSNSNSNSNSNWIESYGLGLPIVQMLLKAHQASLKIESEIGKGTKVTIKFPKSRIVYD